MENTDKKRGITVGIFIFLGIAIFLLGVFTLGGQKKTFVKTFELNVVFDDIQGLKTGNNVWFSGVKIGTIKKIQFYGTSQVQVSLSIDESAHQYIHKDAKASISSDGLIGNKIVVIDGGSVKFPFVEDGDQLQVNKTLSTDDIMKTLQVNNRNLVDITTDFKILAKNLVEGKGTVGALMTDEQIATNFKTIVANLNNTTASANKMAVELNKFSNKLNNEEGFVNRIMADTIMFRKLETSVAEFQSMAKSAAVATENLNKASAQLNNNDNALGLLLNDKKTAEQLKNVMGNLEASSQKLDENMKALQSNFLFRGYFKKKAKEEKSE
ncbi:Mammalian cell entry related domain protein [Pseudopedobacter saltans DSM 12145]|uniref:Mammalian cell entry related domain protein n=1 Tax=Pseudopedobacter saltans (strain ATCC 51119 / DSM 12145 / JCM 21818 / CCUG 39354 / LMG 10337 / NBRC 100064 / NCIMB 13643) TaxID=762903 RepID=F0S7S3_PSESL|nr:MlaD family protein [Pseudopedobacter saltans]ADY53328.1 Mammalian cell entry related domain protein [Pseudopedobacter saltans DSM 12145]